MVKLYKCIHHIYIYIKDIYSAIYIKVQWLLGGKTLMSLFELNSFLLSNINLTGRMTDRKTMVNKSRIFRAHFLENELSKTVTSKKTLLLPLIKFKFYTNQKFDFRKLLLPL